jgi:hypothetical protein
MTIGSARNNKPALIFICAWILAALIGCLVKPLTQREKIVPPPADSKPKETPVALQPTEENHGKRCEAKYYFGVGRRGPDEGYNPFCYNLQLRLVKAAQEGNLNEIRETLKYGAHPNLPVDDSFPPLQTAAANGRTDAAQLLLANGAQVNQISDFENTPLNAAASYGKADVVRLLLAQGANVCHKSSAGTAGDIARARGYAELAELLKAAEFKNCK